ncbi:MAG: rhodanese-related sulfurtransferase [Lewinellaceae bacterium]|nr:rhodanese-related sulfurtransferase [Saprospiraceae bacterium]MCB9313108.1 rhodanese-related sulfurtransferase [Lewinellaceae bacterium]
MRLINLVNNNELKRRLEEDPTPRITLSFYRYAHILNPGFFRDHLYWRLSQCGVYGRIYVAAEGINGQISVPEPEHEHFKQAMEEIDFLKGIRLNYAIEDNGKSFYKLIIKVRKKIVADGLNDDTFDVTKRGGHLSAEEFNRLAENPETIIVDMRNHYESEVGHFQGAILPEATTFREALPMVRDMLADKRDKPVVMYCTGGIRCEKASAWMKHNGFQEVYQLDGGIIEYARQVEQAGLENKFLGKNFVFDERLGERISGEIIAHCHQCGAPADTHVNCANDACHLLFIQCDACAEKYQHTCSEKCQEFNTLPEEERIRLRKTENFNGSSFGKGRYRAHKPVHSLH